MECFVHQPMRLVCTGSTTSELIGSGRSNDSVEHQTDSQRIQVSPMEWTDVKHSLYLKSMEASFVDHLYSTSNLYDWHSQKDGLADTSSFRNMHASTYFPSGEVYFQIHSCRVLQDGCWSKKDFRRDESQKTKAEQSRALPPSPWIRHFKAENRKHAAQEPDIQGKNAPALHQFLVCGDYLCRPDSISVSEVSGQNFPDKDVVKVRTSRIRSAKRMRTSRVSNSSNDHVVPFGLFL